MVGITSGTSDLKLAEITAMPLIREHKAFMYQRRPTVTPYWHRAYEPGLHVIDGEQIIATDRELQFLDDSHGEAIRREPNGGPAELLTARAARRPRASKPTMMRSARRPPSRMAMTPCLKPTSSTMASTASASGQARDIWHYFRTVVKKPLKQCTRDDGRAIVDT